MQTKAVHIKAAIIEMKEAATATQFKKAWLLSLLGLVSIICSVYRPLLAAVLVFSTQQSGGYSTWGLGVQVEVTQVPQRCRSSSLYQEQGNSSVSVSPEIYFVFFSFFILGFEYFWWTKSQYFLHSARYSTFEPFHYLLFSHYTVEKPIWHSYLHCLCVILMWSQMPT